MAVQPLVNGSAAVNRQNGDAVYEEVAESLAAEAASGDGEGEGDEEPLYVNAKQFQRILKRREVSLVHCSFRPLEKFCPLLFSSVALFSLIYPRCTLSARARRSVSVWNRPDAFRTSAASICTSRGTGTR